MLTLHRILCPVDFSEPSKRALRYALAVARWHEAEIAVLHVEDPLLHAVTVEAGGFPELVERHYQELRDFIDAAGGTSREVRLHIATGRAVTEILEHATGEGADLIVMGTNGRSGIARAVLGSVTEGVVRQATMPVLTIPPSAEVKELDELMPFDSILFASEFSAACKKALESGDRNGTGGRRPSHSASCAPATSFGSGDGPGSTASVRANRCFGISQGCAGKTEAGTPRRRRVSLPAGGSRGRRGSRGRDPRDCRSRERQTDRHGSPNSRRARSTAVRLDDASRDASGNLPGFVDSEGPGDGVLAGVAGRNPGSVCDGNQMNRHSHQAEGSGGKKPPALSARRSTLLSAKARTRESGVSQVSMVTRSESGTEAAARHESRARDRVTWPAPPAWWRSTGAAAR